MSTHSPPWMVKTRFGVGIFALFGVVAIAWLVMWALLAPLALGWSSVAVTSGSMSPGIDAGDVVIAEPHDGNELGPGTVIVYDDPAGNGRITHRIVALTPSGSYVTRGDANGRVDSTPVPPESVRAVGRILVPYVGKPYVWAANRQWPKLLGVALILGLASWMSRWGLLDRFVPRRRPPSNAAGPAHVGARKTTVRFWTLRLSMVALAVLSVVSNTTGAGSGAAWLDVSETTGSSFTADTLNPPTGATATSGATITVDWTATPDTNATGHRVYRSDTAGGPYSQIAEITPRTATTYIDNPTPGTYYYVVRAYRLNWESINSNEATGSVANVGLWITVGGGGTILTSADAITWTAQTSGTTELLTGVAYDGVGLWTAVGGRGTILTSADGITWTSQTSGTTQLLYEAAYDGVGLWTVVGWGGTILTSADGITWISQTSGTSTLLAGVAYDGVGLWTAVGGGGTILTSADGITWTSQTAGPLLVGVAHDGVGLWTAVGAGGTILTSPDAITWTSQTSGTPDSMYEVAYDGVGLWITVGGGGGAAGTILTSADGITWASQTSGTTNWLYGVAYDGVGLWTTVSDGGAILTSADGITWTSQTSGTTNVLSGVEHS